MGRPELGNLLSRMRTAWHRAGDWLLAGACFVLSLLLYLRTLAPTVVTLFDDTLEFPLAVQRMAIAHPTGYPLYLLLGRLFSLLPWRDVAGRVNLLSAVAGAAAVALLFLVARQLTRRQWPALLAAGLLAVSPVFWSQAVVAEVYTLNAAFVAGLLLAAMRWAQRPLRDTLTLPSSTAVMPADAGTQEPSGPEVSGEPDGRALAHDIPAGEFAEEAAALNPSPEPQAIPPKGQGAWAARGRRLLGALRRAGGRAGDALSMMARRARPICRRILPRVPAEARLSFHPAIYGLAALLGLALSHHRTAALLVPALLVFTVLTERRIATRAALLGPEHPQWPRARRAVARPWFLLLAAFFLPLLLYLYLPIRGHVGSLDETYVNTWTGFWRWVLADSYGSFLGENPLARSMDAAGYAGLFWAQLGPLGLALAVVGLAGLVRRPRLLVLTGFAFLTFLAFGILYRAPDLEVFFIPAFLLVAAWAAAGLDNALDLLRIRGPSLALRRLQGAAGLLLVLGAAVQVALTGARTYPAVDRSHRWQVHDLAQFWLRPAQAAGGSVVGLLGEVTLLRYFQETEGLAPGLRTVVADDPASRLVAVEREIGEGRTVYVTRSLAGLPERYSLSAVTGVIDAGGEAEALVRVGTPTYDTAGIPNAMVREVAPEVDLLGYSLHEHAAHGQGWVTLRLWWRAAEGVGRPLKVSARLVDPQGEVTAAIDGEPVAWTYPATAWRPGEVVADAYEVPWPAGAVPGTYVPLVILYDPANGEERGRVELPAQSLSGNPGLPYGQFEESGVARVVNARFGEVRLVGRTAPRADATHARGSTLALTLLWQVAGAPTGDLHLEVWLGDGTVLLAEEPVGGSYPVHLWARGQAVRQVVRVSLPADLTPGRTDLRLRVLRQDRPVAWSRGIVPGGSDLVLGVLVVE